MTELNPGDSLVVCERALRQLFARVYADTYGSDWVETVERDPDKRRKWARIREDERVRRTPRGVMSIPEGDLDYAEFGDLVRIAAAHWAPLEPAFGPEDETLPLLRRFERLRNTVAHSREPLAFERDLLSGIAGEIRNRVTKYMTDSDPSGDHYPRIESVTDSFGRSSSGDPSYWGRLPDPNPRLRVGDAVTFDCVGHDPHGRELHWTGRVRGELMFNLEGDRVQARWVVREDHVGQRTRVEIRLASDAVHHRHGFGSHDDSVVADFTVEPPSRAPAAEASEVYE